MHIKKFISEKSFAYSLIGNIVIMAFYFTFFTCFFETCDDFIMKMIAAGSFTGTPDNHLIYISTFLGSIMAFLYGIFPHIAWYEIVQVAIMLVSFSAISYVLIRKHRRFEVLIWLLMFALSYSFYVSFQFTKTTAVPTVAGYLLIADVIDNNDKNYKLVFGLILLFLGMSLRFNQFFVCSFVAVPLFIPILLNFLKDHKEKENGIKVLKLMTIASLVLLYLSDLSKYHPSFKGMSIVAAVSFVIWCCIWFDDLWINREGSRQLSEYRTEICKTLAEDQDHLYIYSTLDRFWVNELLFKDISYLKFTNVQSLGEWVTYLPFVMDTWDRYEIVNPFKDIVNNDKVFLFI